MEKKYFKTESEAWQNRHGTEDFIAVLPNGKEIQIYSFQKCVFCGQIWEPSVHDVYTCAHCGAS